MIDFESKRSGNAYYHTIDIHNLNFGQHTHRSYEMIFIKAGILKVTIENTEYIIKPNIWKFASWFLLWTTVWIWSQQFPWQRIS